MGTFEVKKSTDGQFYFSLKAANGERILASELYREKKSALNGIESVKKNALDPARYEKKLSNDGKPFFVLKALNHEIIGKSETYSSESARDNGIASVTANAPSATIVDNS